MKHEKVLLMLLLLTIGVVMHVNAQQVITNSGGQRIVIYPDGSWRTYEPADSVLLRTRLKKDESFAEQRQKPGATSSRSPSEIVETAMLAEEFAGLTAREVREANRFLSETVDRKFELEAQVRQARENEGLVNPEKVKELEESFKDQERLVAAAKKHLKAIEKFSREASKIAAMPVEKQERPLAKLMVEHESYFSSEAPAGVSAGNPGYAVNTLPAEPSGKGKGATFISSRKQPDHIRTEYRRQGAQCAWSEITEGDERAKRLVTSEPQLLFTYTDTDLRPYFRDRELLSAFGQLTEIDDNVFFIVTFSVASPNARKNFGSLANGSLLRLELIDDTTINLYNLQGDQGRIDAYTGNTVFIGRYKLEKDIQRALRKSRLDVMRVVWTSGYEDYEVYNLDFFETQLSCLESIR